MNTLAVNDFDYQLPQERIAQEPLAQRDAAKLLVVHPSQGSSNQAAITDQQVCDLPRLLRRGDLLVFNRSRVIPARLQGQKASGGRVEILLVHRLPSQPDETAASGSEPADADGPTQSPAGERWQCLIRGKVSEGVGITIADSTAQVVAVHDDGSREVLFPAGVDVMELAHQHGSIPLPPYIDRPQTDADRERYQTVFADSLGSVAAPTAALHFTEALLDELEAMGVERAMVDLAVGPGTFKPIQADRIEDHHMHAEYCECPPETVAAIDACRQRGGRVIAVGTTVVRTLESAAARTGSLEPFAGWTTIFLHPPKQLQTVDGLLTNFHLPRSTLLMLVACLTGTENLQRYYQHAITAEYRFYSYGDAMLILPAQ